MNLPFFKKSNSSAPREYLFALQIDHHVLKSSIWSVVNNKPQVLSIGPSSDWDDHSADSLIQASDKSLTAASTSLDPSGKIQPEKVILGLPADWIVQDKIQSEKLKLLKTLSQQLSLSVVGFVVTPEAIVDHLQHIDGVPPTALLIGVQPAQLDITLVRLGKTEGTHAVVRSKKIVPDVIEGLSRFSHVDMFPSRILLYSTTPDNDDIRQQLLAHPWQSPQTHLPFLHFPKIENLPADFSIQAISLSGGLEVAQATGLTTTDELPAASPHVQSFKAVDPTPQDLGFVLDADVNPAAPKTPPAHLPPLTAVPVVEEASIDQDSVFIPPSKKRRPGFTLPKFNLPKLPLSRLTSSTYIIALVVFILLFTSSAVAAYWYLPKATVTLTVNPKAITHQFDLTADSSVSAPDVDGLKLPAQSVEVTASDEKSQPTTGSKLIGDKATGEVVLINGTSQSKNFAAGTVISSPSGLKFLLNSDASVASASGTADPNSYQPGKATVKITAEKIGTDSNISAGTEFKIGSFSSLDYIAKNETAFSGGSSRQVKAVSKEDLASLRTALTDAVRSKAAEQLNQQISPDQTVVSESTQLQTTTEAFSHKVDDIADDLKLTLSVKASALIITKADLTEIVSSQIASQIPQNYSLTDDISYKFTVKDPKSGLLNVEATANLMPQLDLEPIKANLAGKYPEPAVSYLQTLPGVSRVDITFPFPLPKPLLTLPRISKNITLVVSPSN